MTGAGMTKSGWRERGLAGRRANERKSLVKVGATRRDFLTQATTTDCHGSLSTNDSDHHRRGSSEVHHRHLTSPMPPPVVSPFQVASPDVYTPLQVRSHE